MSKIPPGEQALRDAFKENMHLVNNGYVFTDEQRTHGLFSYILTPKQCSALKRICNEQGWPPCSSKGITITVYAFAHALKARKTKDGASVDECAEIMAAAYNKRSEIAHNKKRKNQQNKDEAQRQSIILNAQSKINIQGSTKYGLAILQVEKDFLSQVTAYDATLGKINAMKDKRK